MKLKHFPFFLYFIAGFFSLVLQLIWQKKLLLIFGGTFFSIAIILSSWMAGMSLGSILIAKFSNRISHSLQFFSLLQIILAMYSFILPPVLKIINQIDRKIFLLEMGDGGFSLIIRSAILFLVILFPAIIVGTGFPLLSGVIREKNISLLYGWNALGSAVGSIFTGFVFLYFWGSTLTIIIICFLSIIINLFGILFGNYWKENKDMKKEEPEGEKLSKPIQIYLKFIIPIFFMISGFTSLSYELLYNRLLIYFTGNNTYCFAIITAVFIFCLSIGSFLYQLVKGLCNTLSKKIIVFSLLELLIGIWHIFFQHYSLWVNDLVIKLKEYLSFNMLFSLFFNRLFSSILLIAPPVIAFGFIFPLVIDIYFKFSKIQSVKNIGFLYASNTIGSVIGPILTGFFLIGIFGLSGTLHLVAGMNILISILLIIPFFWISISKINKCNSLIPLVLTFVILFAGTFILFKVTQKYQEKSHFITDVNSTDEKEYSIGEKAALTFPTDALLYYKEGVFGTVTVSKRYNGDLYLKINGVGEVPTDYNSIRTFRMLAYLPFVFHPNPESVLTIAFGGGITFGSINQIESLKKVINVELCEDVLEAAQLFDKWNHGVLKKYRKNIRIGDGRRFVDKTNEKFDLIISDSTHPNASDSWVLYTKEFYKSCRLRLNKNGVMAQWVPIHHLSIQDYKTILKTFTSVFPEAELFYSNEYTIIIGCVDKVFSDRKRYEVLMNNSEIKNDLEKVNLNSFSSLRLLQIFGSEDLVDYAQNGKIAVDSHSPLQFAEIRSFGKDTRVEILNDFIQYRDKNEFSNEWIYLKSLMFLHILDFKKDYPELVLKFEETKTRLMEIDLFDKEMIFYYQKAKDKLRVFFSNPENLNIYLSDPSEVNIKKIEDLCIIYPDEHNLQLLRAILYYKINRNYDSLSVFRSIHHKKADISTYQNLIILLRRMDKHNEADQLLIEARKLYGEKWGKGLDK